METFVKCVKEDYANFEGRATRKEFWLFTAFFAVLTLALQFITGFLSGITSAGAIKYLYLVFVLLMIAPQVAVAVRRLHDTGKSGKLLLVGLVPVVGLIVLIVWFCGKTDDGKKNNNKKIGNKIKKEK